MDGERALLYAMLENAIRDKDSYWLCDDPRDEDAPFSFRWTCDHLGLDAARIAADLPGIAERLSAARRGPRKKGNGRER